MVGKKEGNGNSGKSDEDGNKEGDGVGGKGDGDGNGEGKGNGRRGQWQRPLKDKILIWQNILY